MSNKRANKEGNIRLRADGRWEVRVTIGIDFATGEPKRVSRYASTQEEAVKLLHELSFIRDTSPKNFQTITLGEWLDLCLEVYMKNSLKQSTYLSYEGYIRIHLKPALGNIQLRDLSPRLLQQFYNYKAETEGLAPKTIVNINLFLHKALSYSGGNMLHIRRTLNRLNKIDRPASPGENTTEIVIQTPKTQNSIQSIPLLPAVVQDLMNWRTVQKNDQIATGDRYQDSGMIVTNQSGGYIEPRTFKDYYNQILNIAGLRHLTFHALRHTFASRAMEQGMDVKTLSVLLGHYSVSFTLDTYAHVLNDHKVAGMALMEDLYTAESASVHELFYPIIVTMQKEGEMLLEAPDFPQVQFCGTDFGQGLQYMKDRLQEELLLTSLPPVPTSPSQLSLASNQYLIQIPA